MILSGITATAFAKNESDIKQDMNEEQFRAAGLHKLSAAELAALNNWLNRSAPPPAAPLTPAATVKPAMQKQATTAPLTEFGEEQLAKPIAAEVPTEINARLLGEFRGWDGKTVFRLDNGQVWRQRVGGSYRSPRLNDPEVQVTKGRYGYYLKIVKSGRSVGVKRIK